VCSLIVLAQLRDAWSVSVSVFLAGCAPLYGANFDYPSDPPIPPKAVSVASDFGWDDDDPLRARVQVLDLKSGSLKDLLDFYVDAFPTSRGWTQVPTADDQVLCLANRSDERYTELVELFPYRGSRVDVGSDRYLAMISRFEQLQPDPLPDDDPCGLATAWVSMDLLE
jgi:hypothetical protein